MSRTHYCSNVKPAYQAGFSLIEIMVAVAIASLMIGIVAYSVGRSLGDTPLEAESKRLKVLMNLASEESIIFNQSLGVKFLPDSYSFYRLEQATPQANTNATNAVNNPAVNNQFLPQAATAQGTNTPPATKPPKTWEPIEEDDFFNARTLPEGMSFDVFIDGVSIILEKEDFKGETFNQEEEEIKPNLFLTADGEIFPEFEVRILDERNDELWAVINLNEEGDLQSNIQQEAF